MRMPARSVGALSVVLAVLAGLLSGCTAAQDDAVTGSSAAVSQSAATTLSVPHGPVVTLPKGSVSGSGRISVAQTSRDELRGWSIRLGGGAKLRKTVTLSFPLPRSTNDAPAVMAYSEPPSTAIHLVAARVSEGRLIVRTDHFSNWWQNVTGYLHEQVLGWLVDELGTVDVAQPSCSGLAKLVEAGWGYRSTKTKTALECIGATSGGAAPQVKLANRLGIPLQLEVTKGMKVDAGTAELDDQLGKLLTEASTDPFTPGATSHFLASGETAVIEGKAGTKGGVLATPSGVAILAGTLMTAVKTLLLVDGWAGESIAQKNLMQALESEDCMAGIESAAVGRSVKTGGEAAKYLAGLVQPVFDCATDYVKRKGVGGLLTGTVVQVLEWLAAIGNSGAQVLTGALVSAYEPKGNEIDVSPPAALTCPAGYEVVETAYNAGGSITWCDRADDEGLPTSGSDGEEGDHVQFLFIVDEPGIRGVFASHPQLTGQGRPIVQDEQGRGATIDFTTTADGVPMNGVTDAAGRSQQWVVTRREYGPAAGKNGLVAPPAPTPASTSVALGPYTTYRVEDRYRTVSFASPDGSVQCSISQFEDSAPWGCVVGSHTWATPRLPDATGTGCGEFGEVRWTGAMVATFSGGGFTTTCVDRTKRVLPHSRALPVGHAIRMNGVTCRAKTESRIGCTAAKGSTLDISTTAMTYRDGTGWTL